MVKADPGWIAPRTGQDWHDDDIMLAVAWLKSLVPAAEMERRVDAARAHHDNAWHRRLQGEQTEIFDPADLAAWYVMQAQSISTDRAYFTEEGTMRVAPYLKRIGQDLPLLLTIDGAEERAARMMTNERRQPDGPLFELLVALAYKRQGWSDVRFVPEIRGGGRTPDLLVSRPRKRWAVECKRMMPSLYTRRENRHGMALAAPVHALALERYEAVVVEVVFKVELETVAEDYLLPFVSSSIDRRRPLKWNDDVAMGTVRPVNWQLIRSVMEHDFVYFGGSRMIELLVGRYTDFIDHSLSARWRAHEDKPAFADTVYHASLVSWTSTSTAATSKKARHFKKLMVDAEGQLPADRPGVIHVGMESRLGKSADFNRHARNWIESRLFEPTNPRLRWVYGNYFIPECTTDQNETWAITETSVPYKIGTHKTKLPLPNQLLVSPSDVMMQGGHWSRP